MNDEILAQIVSAIVRVASPEQIILFGSYARGDAGPESDLDLLVVESGAFDQTRSRRAELARLWKALAHFMIAKDILVYSKEEVEQVTEKTLKAWLAWLGVEYSKTHDISLLLAELEQSGINADQFSDMIEYNVFAVQFRYEAYDTALDALDRQETIQHLAGLVEYVEGLLR